MNRRHFDWIWLIIVPGLLFSLWLICYPAVNTEIYEHQAADVIEALEQQIVQAESQQPHRLADGEQIYAELAEAMISYNDKLAEEQELRLTGVEAYETPALDLTEFGLEADSPIGAISIPSIDVELPLYLGAGQENMAKGAVVLGGTSLPIGGEDTNCVVAGHRGYRGIPYFRYADRLEAGDMVYLRNFWTTLAYTVTDSAVIPPDDIGSVLIQQDKDMLTLLTCHPYGIGTDRLVIYCQRRG